METCKQCSLEFEITDSDQQFYKKVDVPEPNFCPDCRQQRRLAWRNERTLYRRKCDGMGKEIISVYSPDKPFPVYDSDYWHSDAWNPLTYGRDFDFDRPFFEQFEELMHKVPQIARSTVANENCNFVNQCGWCKDCYLIFEADHNRSCIHSNNIFDSRDSMDILRGIKNELCYECIDCNNCYNLKFSQDCNNCSDSWFLKNCIGCNNCFGSVNLRKKQYYFFNQKCSKEEYEEKVENVSKKSITDIEKIKKEFKEIIKKFPQKYIHGIQNEDSIGDHLHHTQRCLECFDVNNAQDCKWVFDSRNTKMVYDMTVFGGKGSANEFCCDNHEIGGGVRNVFYSDQVWESCHDIYYSKLVGKNSHHMFGCIGFKHAEYCILNKQYKREEYEELVPKIIEHMKKTDEWGEFFPAKISPYGYNETIAPIYYPLNKEEALEKGFNWSDYESPPLDVKKTIPADRLPDNIKEIPDDILSWAITCEVSGKPFKLVPLELKFYREHNLPIPHKHPDVRHVERMKSRNPRKLHHRRCMNKEAPHDNKDSSGHCLNEFETTYSPERPEIVFCEQCYLEALD